MAHLPDGSILNAEITVRSYFDDQGVLRYDTSVTGNPNIAQYFGLLVLAGISGWSSYIEDEMSDEEEEEDDEDE